MKILPIAEKDYPALKKMFCDYYAELDCEEDPLPLFDDCLLPDLKAGLFYVAVCDLGGQTVGFVIYQIDDVINDWNFKEGCGDIRELFVKPGFRRQGVGRALVGFAVDHLKRDGAAEIYALPTEESETFFVNCGFGDTGEYCPEADNKVFGKLLP